MNKGENPIHKYILKWACIEFFLIEFVKLENVSQNIRNKKDHHTSDIHFGYTFFKQTAQDTKSWFLGCQINFGFLKVSSWSCDIFSADFQIIFQISAKNWRWVEKSGN